MKKENKRQWLPLLVTVQLAETVDDNQASFGPDQCGAFALSHHNVWRKVPMVLIGLDQNYRVQLGFAGQSRLDLQSFG